MIARRTAERVATVLRNAGFEALFAGGCVRDLILGLDPVDWDIATSAPPEAVVGLFDKTSSVGAVFGVVIVHSEGEPSVEVATFRSDGLYVDGRRPTSVTFSDAAEDARRRDFTINGLFLDPGDDSIRDFVGGRADIKSGVIRAIGDPHARFGEDRLRMLRAVRFASRLGFVIEPETLAAIRNHAAEIHDVSPERIRVELDKILIGGGASRGLEWLLKSGLLVEILPEIAAMVGVEQPPEFHPEGDVWTHTLRVMDGVDRADDRSRSLAWGALLHDVGKPPTFSRSDRIRFNGHAAKGAEMTKVIAERLRFSREVTDRVVDLVASHMTFKDVMHMRSSRLRRFLGHENYAERLQLHLFDCAAASGAFENADFCRAKVDEFAHEPLIPPRLLTGHDLIAAGFQPGPSFDAMLEAAHDAQLEGDVVTTDEALAMVIARFGPPE